MEQAKREHDPERRLLALSVEAVFFLTLFLLVLIALLRVEIFFFAG
jgi:hypothetical protein